MTKSVTRKLAVDCLLFAIFNQFGVYLKDAMGEDLKPGNPIQFDHIHADALGGEHRYDNLRPLQASSHKKKTKRDVQALAKIDRITGVTGNGPKKRIPSKPFPKRTKPYVWPKREMRS